MKRTLLSIILFINLVHPTNAIQFIDVTRQAGIDYTGNSFGASWGDVNGDGWPDIWLGNHARFPKLYINNADGTFTDQISTIIPDLTESRDMHGAAFADYDNDGDQDLIILTGAAYGTGRASNYLYNNHQGRFSIVNGPLNYSLGRGRTPLWLDWNGDGLLDVLTANAPRPDGQAPTALFSQEQGDFANTSAQAGLTSESDNTFAQLFTIGSGYRPAFLLNGRLFPDRLFAYDTTPLQNIREQYSTAFAKLWNVRDAVTADLDGNLLPDILALRSRETVSEAVQSADNRIEASLFIDSDEKRFRFQTDGNVAFQIYPYWRIGLNRIFIGEAGSNPPRSRFTLAPADAPGNYPHTPGSDFGVYIGYDETRQTWEVSVSNNIRFTFDLIITAEAPIRNLTRLNFENTDIAQPDRLLLQYETGLVDNTLAAGLQMPTPCASGVAADFDNDMDLDLYLACRGVSGNRQNILYENLGSGLFQTVENAGGAGGSLSGRADTVAAADYDRDGFVDLLVTNGRGTDPFADGPTQLFRNQGNANHWLEIDLQGTRSNRDGIGAYLLLTTGGTTQYRLQDGGMHRFTQNASRIHFGLGGNETADTLTIHWPSGTVQRLLNTPADQVIRIVEAEGSTDLSALPPESEQQTSPPATTSPANGGGGALSLHGLALLLLLSVFANTRTKRPETS